jgi:hypothetical protein
MKVLGLGTDGKCDDEGGAKTILEDRWLRIHQPRGVYQPVNLPCTLKLLRLVVIFNEEACSKRRKREGGRVE